MQNALARVRNPALRQGLIFGIVLGIILLVLSLFGLNVITFTLILCLAAAFIAGMRSSQETRRITTGILAGLWTGLLGILIPSVISFVLLLINIDAARKGAQLAANEQHQHITYTNSLILELSFIYFIILLVLGVLSSVIGGLLGGVFGSRRAQLPPVEHPQEAMYEAHRSSEIDEPLSNSEVGDETAESETEEPLSETPSKNPSSPTQQVE